MIRFENISLSFGQSKGPRLFVADGFTLTLERGEFSCILGPSGCGKTTLLNMIAGLQVQDEGELLIDNVTVDKSKQRIGYVFQGNNIFPWKTVRQNIHFGLISLEISNDEKARRIEKIARDVGLTHFLDSYPDALSGGMKQRVGIARALVGDADIILMDEPFASLDALTAVKTRKLLKNLCAKRDVTVVFVTHNIDEALELGDRILAVSKSPMNILIDKRLPKNAYHDSTFVIKFKDKIYDALKSNMSE